MLKLMNLYKFVIIMDYTLPAIISILYFCILFFKMRFTENDVQEEKPMKTIVYQSFLVFLTSCLGVFVHGQLFTLISETAGLNHPPIFVDEPNF